MGINYTYEQILLQRIDFSQNRPLTDILYESLREAILDESIPLGHRINENSLAKQLSISRTPIRKSIKRLVDEGLLEYVPDYGVIVTSVSTHKINEIYGIRLALELILHEELLKSASDEAIQGIYELCQKLKSHTDPNDVEQLAESLSILNARIHEAAGLSTLTMVLDQMSSYTQFFREYSFSIEDRRADAVKEHIDIVSCLVKKDLDGLREKVTHHITSAQKAAVIAYEQGKRRVLPRE